MTKERKAELKKLNKLIEKRDFLEQTSTDHASIATLNIKISNIENKYKPSQELSSIRMMNVPK